MKRRSFLKQASLAFAGTVLSAHSLSADTPAVDATFTAGDSKLASVPKDFTGVSIEAPQLYNPNYYSAKNKSLVEAFRALSSNGVLRSGGHLSDVARWKGPNGDFSTPKQDAGIALGKTYWEWKLTDPSVRDTRDGAITAESIESLKTFLDATNWRLIYGLNFGCGSIERAADESSFVAKTMGDRLIAFQLGNEDDQLVRNSSFRAPGYNFDIYYEEYLSFVAGIRKAVPNARFGGPDVAGNMDWIRRFAEKRDNAATFISSHYYAMGPAKDPTKDAAFLLGSDDRLARQITQIKEAIAASNGVPYRMTEGNSCFGGGKPNVSDAYASALWGADYMLQCASAGYAGVNLHGGGDGYYTSIAVGPNLSTELRPLYYGMQFADDFAGADFFASNLTSPANVRGYYARRGPETLVALINGGKDPINVKLSGVADRRPPTTETRLSGPALDAKTGITLSSSKPSPSLSQSVLPYSAVLLKWS